MFRHGFAAITAISLALAGALGVASLARADDTISATPSHLAPNASPDAETRVAFVSRPGLYGPADGIAVANLTVQPGQYVVEYTFEARLDSAFAASELYCGITDNNGVDHFIAEDSEPIASGVGWERHTYSTTFSLGDVTLGIRCTPRDVGLHRASFRGVEFAVTRMPFDL